jgi:prophage tail gpP-like protein
MVRRSYDNAISVFEFTPTENDYGSHYQSLRLKPGDEVSITLAGQLALTGRVTTRTVAYDGKSHQIVVAGRTIGAVLRDASVKVKQGNYDGYTFEQAARSVMQPHNISLVMSEAGDDAKIPFKRLSVQYGESPAEFIGRLAMQRGLYLSDDPKGNLVASKPKGNAPSSGTFTEGVNILRATCKMDDQGQAGKHTGVAQAPGSDSSWPSRAISASVTTSGSPPDVERLFLIEHPTDSANDLKARVQYEADVSSLPVFTVSVTVIGWTTNSGELWSPLMKASVYSPMLFWGNQTTVVCGIQSVTFQQDSANGSTTTLEMTLPNLLSKTAFSNAQQAPLDSPKFFGGSDIGTAKPDTPDSST